MDEEERGTINRIIGIGWHLWNHVGSQSNRTYISSGDRDTKATTYYINSFSLSDKGKERRTGNKGRMGRGVVSDI